MDINVQYTYGIYLIMSKTIAAINTIYAIKPIIINRGDLLLGFAIVPLVSVIKANISGFYPA
jgi:hypothetical protein